MIVYQEAAIPDRNPDHVRMLPAMPSISDLRLSTFRPIAVNRGDDFAKPRAEDISTLRIRKPAAIDAEDEVATVEAKVAEVFDTADTVRPEPIEETLDERLEPSVSDLRLETTQEDEVSIAMSDSEIAFGRGRRTRSTARGSKGWLFVAAGATCVALIASALLRTSVPEGEAYAEAKEPSTNGLTSETHSALLGNGDQIRDVSPTKQATEQAEAAPVKNPLPELVDVDALAAKRRATKVSTQPTPEAKAIVETTPAASVAEAPKAKLVEKKVEEKTAEKAEPKKIEAPVVAAPKKVEVAAAAKPAPKKEPAPAVAAHAKHYDAVFSVSDGAKVLRTFVLKSPARFVVDLTGQEELPGVTKGDARVGKHDDFMRIVIDSDTALTTGLVDKRNGQLYVSLIQ